MAEAEHDFSGIGPECDCPAEPYRHRHIGGSQPVAEADDAMRERLDDTLHDALCQCRPGNHFGISLRTRDLDAATDALLPTVRALIADELRAAADDLADDEESDPAYIASAALLYARADALDPR